MLVLLLSLTASASTTACLETPSGAPLAGLRVESGPTTATTNTSGCFTVPQEPAWCIGWWCTDTIPIVVYAQSRTTRMITPLRATPTWPVQVADGDVVEIDDDVFRVASRLDRAYVETLYDVGPWEDDRWAYGNSYGSANFIETQFPSPESLAGWIPYCEPAGVVTNAPVLHMSDDAVWDKDWVFTHELGHALHFSQLSVGTRQAIEAQYLQWLADHVDDATHTYDKETSPLVAWVEAIGWFVQNFRTETDPADGTSQRIREYAAHYKLHERRYRTVAGPETEGAVHNVLFTEFAPHPAVGLDYVWDTITSCESMDIHDYADCIRGLEGESSEIYTALVQSAARWTIGLPEAAVGSPLVDGDADYCTPELPCPVGVGDCDTNADCAGAAVCQHNEGYRFGYPTKTDVCVLRNTNKSTCNDQECTHGMGDCDSDDDCAGGATCQHDVGAQYGMPANYDVCVVGGGAVWDHCTPEHPCGLGGGDCQDDDDCIKGTRCATDAGAAYGFPSSVDVCVRVAAFHADACTAELPCPPNLGDCDRNDECIWPAQFCAHDIGASFGVSEKTDICL